GAPAGGGAGRRAAGRPRAGPALGTVEYAHDAGAGARRQPPPGTASGCPSGSGGTRPGTRGPPENADSVAIPGPLPAQWATGALIVTPRRGSTQGHYGEARGGRTAVIGSFRSSGSSRHPADRHSTAHLATNRRQRR